MFISGFTADIIAQRGIMADGMCFLPKPFSRDELSQYTGLHGNGDMIFEKPLENVARLAGKLEAGRLVDSESVSRMVQFETPVWQHVKQGERESLTFQITGSETTSAQRCHGANLPCK